jgi:hypothetical protein
MAPPFAEAALAGSGRPGSGPPDGAMDWTCEWTAMLWPPFNSTWSNRRATWEFAPAALGCTAMMCPMSFDPLGISVPLAVFTEDVVWTTTLSPVLAVFESSLLTSSTVTGRKSTAAAGSGVAAGLLGGACAVDGGFCWAAGLSGGLAGWVAGVGCCAQEGEAREGEQGRCESCAFFHEKPPSVATLSRLEGP